MTEPKTRKHSVSLENRGKMFVSGVENVMNFDDAGIVLMTVEGVLSIDGSELRITSLNLETGDVEIEGTVNGFFYPASRTKRGGLFRKNSNN